MKTIKVWRLEIKNDFFRWCWFKFIFLLFSSIFFLYTLFLIVKEAKPLIFTAQNVKNTYLLKEDLRFTRVLTFNYFISVRIKKFPKCKSKRFFLHSTYPLRFSYLANFLIVNDLYPINVKQTNLSSLIVIFPIRNAHVFDLLEAPNVGTWRTCSILIILFGHWLSIV